MAVLPRVRSICAKASQPQNNGYGTLVILLEMTRGAVGGSQGGGGGGISTCQNSERAPSACISDWWCRD